MLEQIAPGPIDPMYLLKKRADEDKSAQKIDLGVGIYRNEQGSYQELDAVKRAKRFLDELNLGHDYESTVGDAEFMKLAAELMFGEANDALSSGRISSVQTISGTGANHMAALLLATAGSTRPKVYIGVPTWSNTIPLFQHVGLEVETYRFIESETYRVDISSCLKAIQEAPPASIFPFQGCCHNPTGANITREQWRMIGHELGLRHHLPVLDIAYQGLGDGLDEDVAAARIFCELGLELLVCQSFSKNFALYGERCGVLHAVTRSASEALNVQDRLRSLIRSEYSSSPAYGSRLVKIVLQDNAEREKWVSELDSMRLRLQRNRSQLYKQLAKVLQTPGDWTHIMEDKGLFSVLGLSPTQCKELVERHHIYLPLNGRINIAGLSLGNIDRAAVAIDEVVRNRRVGKEV